MNNLEDVLQQPILQALGWALVHSLWQGALLAALLAGLLALLRGYSAFSAPHPPCPFNRDDEEPPPRFDEDFR